MILIAGFYHPRHGLVGDRAILPDQITDWFIRANKLIDLNIPFDITTRGVLAHEFSPVVMCPTDARNLINRRC